MGESHYEVYPKCAYRIKVNEELTDEILPTRGLRQGEIHYLHICS